MDPITPALLLKALDGLTLRSIVTAQNIANANSPGYRPLAVNFEDALKRAAATGDVRAIEAVEPRIGQVVDQDGDSKLRLDLELATDAQTASRFAALAELLNRRLQLEALSVSGTR
jgi:flagellar basal-body rod protein FlgB